MKGTRSFRFGNLKFRWLRLLELSHLFQNLKYVTFVTPLFRVLKVLWGDVKHQVPQQRRVF